MLSIRRPAYLTSRALALLITGQFLVVLDVAVVDVAPPADAGRPRLSATGLQWVINGNTIAYAGFLLLVGRAARRTSSDRAPAASR